MQKEQNRLRLKNRSVKASERLFCSCANEFVPVTTTLFYGQRSKCAALLNQCHLVKLIGSNQFKPLTKKFKIVVDIATKMCGRSRY